MPLFSRTRPSRPIPVLPPDPGDSATDDSAPGLVAGPSEPATPPPAVEPPPAVPAEQAEQAAGRLVAPARAPRLPDGWVYRFTSPAMGTARIDVLDHRGRAVAGETFVGHAGSPEFVIAAACARAHAAWQETGGVVVQVQPFTASSSPEGTGWRVWCNQALGVTFVVEDLEQAPALMAQALAQAKGLDPEEVSVTMVASR